MTLRAQQLDKGPKESLGRGVWRRGVTLKLEWLESLEKEVSGWGPGDGQEVGDCSTSEASRVSKGTMVGNLEGKTKGGLLLRLKTLPGDVLHAREGPRHSFSVSDLKREGPAVRAERVKQFLPQVCPSSAPQGTGLPDLTYSTTEMLR